jgi:hypothetical protein
VSVFGKVAVNDNRILEISAALDEYNRQKAEIAQENNSPVPVVMYYNGMPIHSVWAVQPLGINSANGREVFLDRNGDMTTEWNALDLKNFGSKDPLYNGNFGINGEIANFGFNLVMTFYGGGYLYNITLVNKVENILASYNVDRRVFEDRWHTPGQNAPFRSISIDMMDEDSWYTGMTLPTSRFVQKNNVMDIASASVYYEFPLALIQKLKMNRLRATLYINDLYTFSSIHIERGTEYPYARSASFSLTATF